MHAQKWQLNGIAQMTQPLTKQPPLGAQARAMSWTNTTSHARACHSLGHEKKSTQMPPTAAKNPCKPFNCGRSWLNHQMATDSLIWATANSNLCTCRHARLLASMILSTSVSSTFLLCEIKLIEVDARAKSMPCNDDVDVTVTLPL